jgi:predicted MFS family arabinose efflux permease
MTIATEGVLAPSTETTKARWYTLIVLTVVYILNVADRFVVSTLIEPIKAELRLSDSSVALLTGVALAVFYILAGLPIATYADRTNRRNLVASAVAIWSVMMTMCGFAQNYWQFLLARIGVGVGEAGGTAPSNAIISDRFPWNERAFALTVFAAGSSLGSMFGSAGGYVSDAFGWRTVFFFFGIPGIIAALMVRFTLSEPRRGALDARQAPQIPSNLSAALGFMRSQRSMRHCLAGIFFFSLWGYGLMWWTPAFLVRSYGFSVGGAGGTLAPIHGVGGTLMLMLTSWIMLATEQRTARYIPWFIATVIALATIPAFLVYSSHSFSTTHLMLWIFFPLVYAAVGPFFSLIQNLSPPRHRAQACAIALLVANIGNLIVAPQCVGIASDLLVGKHGHESLRLALIPLSLVGLLAAFHFWSVARTVEHDMRVAGAI